MIHKSVKVYAPTNDYEDEAVEDVCEEVSKVMEERKAEYTMVMGNFNAKMGIRHPGEGKFGVGRAKDQRRHVTYVCRLTEFDNC